MKTVTKELLKKALPIFAKKTTWAVIIAIPVAVLGVKAETASSITDLLSLATSVFSVVL